MVAGLSPSPSSTSLIRSYSSCTCNSGSSVGTTPYSTGPYQHVPYSSDQSPYQTNQMDDQFGLCNGARNADEDEDYSVYRLHSEPSHFSSGEIYHGAGNYSDINQDYGVDEVQSDREKNEPSMSSTLLPENTEAHISEITEKFGKEAEGLTNGSICEVASSYGVNGTASESLDFENNSLLWLPPEPEDKEDEQDALPFDDDEDGSDGASGEWGYLGSSGSFGCGEHRNRERSIEEHRKAMKNVLDGHFRALIAQLLQIGNLPVNEEDGKESWLDIITSLSWEAATLLKPDMSISGGMDPGGYVKVKCIACGRRSERYDFAMNF